MKKGNENVNYLTDNPANQMTYKDGEIKYIDPNASSPAEQDTSLTLGAVPEGAIWVGFEKPLTEDTSTTSLSENPRLYIMRAGKLHVFLLKEMRQQELVVELQEDSHGMVQRILKIIIKIHIMFLEILVKSQVIF